MNKLYTLKEVCSYLAISRSTIYALIASNQIKFVRIGKRGVRIEHDELARYIADSAISHNAEVR